MQKHDDDLHLHVYDDDVADRDSVGSAKIDLKKHVFGKGRYDEWIKLPAMLGLRSKGEIHVIIEHHVSHLSGSNLIMMFVLDFSHEAQLSRELHEFIIFNHDFKISTRILSQHFIVEY